MSQLLPFRKVRSRTIVLIFCYLLPLILSPLLFSSHQESHCAYVILLSALYWLLEPISIMVTGFIPIILFPMLGIMSSPEVSQFYMSEFLLLFLGGMIAAMAIENCNLHERIALKAMMLVGTEIHRLLLGIMLITMFLSMWMSNTSTTAMMLPIVESLTEEMFRGSDRAEEMKAIEVTDACDVRNGKSDVENSVPDEECPSGRRTREGKAALRTTFFLAVCYAANIGGTGTITGTGVNLFFVFILEDYFPDCDLISFATWTMYNAPAALICTLIGCGYIYLVCIKYSKKIDLRTPSDSIYKNISKRYEKLGPWKFSEAAVLVLFITLVFLWIFRDPKFIDGWASIFSVKVGDSLPAITICFLFFMIPSDPRKFFTSPRLMEWKTVERKLQWGIIILGGGGFALASAAKKTGLSKLIGVYLMPLSQLHPVAMVAVICLFTACLTEVMTNTTTANMIIPILGELAVSIRVNPLLLMLPAAVSCSFAFMLPVSTIPNAIVFERGQMKVTDMAKPGVVMNLICCCVQLLMINTLGVAMFNLNEFPTWAKTASESIESSNNFSAIMDSFLYAENGTLNSVTQLL